jgi:hypothetical protein
VRYRLVEEVNLWSVLEREREIKNGLRFVL